MLTKLDAARSQLYTALDLFICNRDPVSIHNLACSSSELCEGLAKISGQKPFSTHIMTTQPDIKIEEIRKLQNQYWNAFKHFFKPRSEIPREDKALLDRFDDTKNDAALFVAVADYLTVAGKLSVAGQVFQMWWYAINPEKLAPDADRSPIEAIFPKLSAKTRDEQKRILRRTYEKYRHDKKLLADPRTDK